jgi:hypothetical protein
MKKKKQPRFAALLILCIDEKVIAGIKYEYKD